MLYRVIPAGDVDLVSGRPVILQGPEAVRQKIATRLKFFLGEWFLNLREGLPYFRVVLVRRPDITLIRTLYRRAILSVQEVASLTSLDVDYDPRVRAVAVEFDAELVKGGVLSVRQPNPPFVIDLG